MTLKVPLYNPAGFDEIRSFTTKVPPIYTKVVTPVVIKGEPVLEAPIVRLNVPELLLVNVAIGPLTIVISVPGIAVISKSAGVTSEYMPGSIILPDAVRVPV